MRNKARCPYHWLRRTDLSLCLIGAQAKGRNREPFVEFEGDLVSFQELSTKKPVKGMKLHSFWRVKQCEFSLVFSMLITTSLSAADNQPNRVVFRDDSYFDCGAILVATGLQVSSLRQNLQTQSMRPLRPVPTSDFPRNTLFLLLGGKISTTH